MPTWNANQYLKFAGERTRPCRDLVTAIDLPAPQRVIDLGCGPGNSTAVLSGRWPEAQMTGLDNSEAMIEAARREQPQNRWIAQGISEWATEETGHYDLVFSNAALHWLPDHATLYPKLLGRVASGGALAVQIPSGSDSFANRLMHELTPASMRVQSWHTHKPAFYYDALAPHAARLDIWETEYQHVMSSAEAIVEWYKGTGLRPFLEAFGTEHERQNFLAEYTKRIREAYPEQPAGKVLFPFRRLFMVAYQVV
jgi:trans-aconitate 2-methyltransferase